MNINSLICWSKFSFFHKHKRLRERLNMNSLRGKNNKETMKYKVSLNTNIPLQA